ncbi:fungal chitosanase of glycosyl hydrolase group 75-domain-containing protein [Mycena albidolilacea]|uniref:Endo-chitosanase n=1 Tax=Mycena albidolilacea TaxID=1033008 RepID=A0AAD6ZAR1_9AGAR|nr:fungal chitosanase of glycosyl hydrolase group 75-domain-containing protein [Mycena albidolilacea]
MKSSISLFLCSLISFAAALPQAGNLTRRDVGFRADPAGNIGGIYLAALASTQVPLAAFPHNRDVFTDVQIYGDWLNLDGVSAFYFFADMDVDCDGVAGCSDDPSGQPETSFGHLDATQVPYFVLPATFTETHGDIVQPNAVGAILCNGQMLYGIFGDNNGATPQVIGEASLLLAETCFPNEGLSANQGHTALDVLYIVFGTRVTPGVGDETIDIPTLKLVGDDQVGLLQSRLGLGPLFGGAPGPH